MNTSDHANRIFADLRRHHLRHPGSVPAKVVKILKLGQVYQSQIDTCRMEWLRLGLNLTLPATVQRTVQDGGPQTASGGIGNTDSAPRVEALKPSDPPGVPADTRVSDERGRRGSNPQPPDRQSGTG